MNDILNEEKEYNNIYAIPANYTDSGKILGGMLELRNAVETVLMLSIITLLIITLWGNESCPIMKTNAKRRFLFICPRQSAHTCQGV